MSQFDSCRSTSSPRSVAKSAVVVNRPRLVPAHSRAAIGPARPRLCDRALGAFPDSPSISALRRNAAAGRLALAEDEQFLGSVVPGWWELRRPAVELGFR